MHVHVQPPTRKEKNRTQTPTNAHTIVSDEPALTHAVHRAVFTVTSILCPRPPPPFPSSICDRLFHAYHGTCIRSYSKWL